MPDRSFDSVTRKVLDIFSELVGDRARRLDGSVNANEAMNAIAAALTDEQGIEKAYEIAFHMADWNWDAAFMVTLHLFPERFTRDEIDAGLRLFLVHAPSHIRAACELTRNGTWVDFSEHPTPGGMQEQK